MADDRTSAGQGAITPRPADGRAASLRRFLSMESASGGVLLVSIGLALVWANLGHSSYEGVWSTDLSLHLGGDAVTDDLRGWVNSGLMTLFFLVLGLEARREFDLGDLRERRRLVLPLAVGLAGMAVPVLLYLAVNVGHGSAAGWGVAMSTDTALALGVLALLGDQVPGRVRIFLVTVLVVDDVAAVAVIALVYSGRIEAAPIAAAVLLSAGVLVAAARRVQRAWVYAVLGVALWGALHAGGVDPIVAGLVIGLAVPAYTPSRGDLEAATDRVRRFREQPTPRLARSAASGLTSTLSLNERLQTLYQPWTSYVVVPLFGLANAGVVLTPDFMADAYVAPVTVGVLLGYLVGKPVGIVGAARVVTLLSRGRIRPPVGWAAVVGGGTISGIGFTVTLLVATRAFDGAQLAQAKLGALTAAVVASLLTFAVYRSTSMLAPAARARALLGGSDLVQDLAPEVDDLVDHVRGDPDAPITIIEFGDFQCEYCGEAEPVVRRVLEDGNVRYVWRHLPLTDVHPQAQLAAEAAEAAAAQGAFWEMRDLLLAHQDHLRLVDVLGYAATLGLDVDRVAQELRRRTHRARVARDVESADLSGVAGTPTFFVNGQRHYGVFDLDALTETVRTAHETVQAVAA